MMGVIPVEPGVRKMDPILKGHAWLDRVLGDARHAVEPILEPDAVPVHRGRLVEPVGDIDRDRRLLRHLDQGTGVLSVEAIHGEHPAVDGAQHETRHEVEGAAVAEPHDLAWSSHDDRFVPRW